MNGDPSGGRLTSGQLRIRGSMDDQVLISERGDRKKSERLAVLTLVAVFLFNVYRFLNI
jgi:hypothetical protein